MPRIRQILSPAIVLVILATATMVFFDRPLATGDGIAYLAWMDTLLIDGDIELNNQVEKLQVVNDDAKVMYDETREKWVNIFPFGITFVQAPFYYLGHWFDTQEWFDVNPEYFRTWQGVGFPYSFWVMIGANLLALITLLMAYDLGREFTDRMTAALVTFTVFVGTPLLYYTTVNPFYSHNASAFTLAATIWLYYRHTNRWWHWVLIGAFAGLTVLTRWQLLLAFIPLYSLMLWRRQWRGFAIATITAAVVLLPLPIIWHGMFGKYFLVPYNEINNEGFVRTPWHGIRGVIRLTFIHSPILIFSLIGIIGLWRFSKEWALACGAIVVLQFLINGSAVDWWAGDSYGMRRMSELLIIYVMALCALIGTRRYWWRVAIRSTLWLFIGYTFFYMAAFMHWTWTHPSGKFSDDPDVMIEFFRERERVFRWQIMDTLIADHVGPQAWDEPGR